MEVLTKCRRHACFRWISTIASSSFKFSDLEIDFCTPDKLKPKPLVSQLQFGKTYSDHMLEVEWNIHNGWTNPKICPIHDLSVHPGSKVLHYAIELFEGMKAYRGVDDRIRLFRPHLNMKRMNESAARSSLPTFDSNQLIKCIKKLVNVDQEWVPHSETSSLYIRPSIIATDPTLGVSPPDSALLFVLLCPVGPYFKSGFQPVSLLADPQYVRAWPGGCGDKKMGSNYAPTISILKEAQTLGHQQVLWLFGQEHYLTEVGTMNIFVMLINENGEEELITPPLSGMILPGITRRCILDLTRGWNEFKVTERNISMREVKLALRENRILEIFGAGTACIVSPVGRISYMNETLEMPTNENRKSLYERLFRTLSDIQYNRNDHGYPEWTETIDLSLQTAQVQPSFDQTRSEFEFIRYRYAQLNNGQRTLVNVDGGNGQIDSVCHAVESDSDGMVFDKIELINQN